ncbi:hypothetical protein F0562_010942 [Nyssa sinensis]|uniref:Bulb-type lectin domain-containing protein n=1 Tax=Nyssa sinensis TaxID=561372 RepID=A0A5J5A2I7_9ASTE|nr:hypothetical protein F0562_010942 [Nyssa sinensis]
MISGDDPDVNNLASIRCNSVVEVVNGVVKVVNVVVEVAAAGTRVILVTVGVKYAGAYSEVGVACYSEDSIAAGKSISFNQTIISAGGDFALGFFSPGNSTNSYLGIWYNTIPKHTVIWVANRQNPILEENSRAVLTLNSSGNLVLLDGRREVIWSTNVTAVNLSVNSITAVLKDSGNLVLKQDEDTVLWQSFDYPTDTFMSGMKISWNRKTGRQILLTSWANDEDPRPGMFSTGIDPKGRPQLFIWKQHDPYWRSNVYDVTLSSGG